MIIHDSSVCMTKTLSNVAYFEKKNVKSSEQSINIIQNNSKIIFNNNSKY